MLQTASNSQAALVFRLMITTRFYLDCRASAPGLAAPLRLVITLRGVRSLLPLNISLLPSQWDARRQIVVGHPRKQQYNSMLAERKLDVDNLLYRLASSGELSGMRSCDIKNRVAEELFLPTSPASEPSAPLFLPRFNSFIAEKSAGTRRVYSATLARLLKFCGSEEALAALTFEAMDVAWLRSFDKWLAQSSPSRNARNIHFRNIRAVFNDAIMDELITCYPFRKFKITPEPTRKRALTLGQLRKLFSLPVEPWEQRYLDCFKIIFGLCGINIVDLCALPSLTNGRADYQRAKTHRLYSIKVEPEVAEWLSQYQGQGQLLNYLDACRGYRSFYNRLCRSLRNLGLRIGIRGLSSYWARHTWATIAASLDIPKETIAAALGHGGHSVTDIYIDFDQRKVDEANRRVLDWVLYGKK